MPEMMTIADLVIGGMSFTRIAMVWVAILDNQTKWPRRSSLTIFLTLCVSFLAFIHAGLYITAGVMFTGAITWMIVFFYRPTNTGPLFTLR